MSLRKQDTGQSFRGNGGQEWRTESAVSFHAVLPVLIFVTTWESRKYRENGGVCSTTQTLLSTGPMVALQKEEGDVSLWPGNNSSQWESLLGKSCVNCFMYSILLNFINLPVIAKFLIKWNVERKLGKHEQTLQILLAHRESQKSHFVWKYQLQLLWCHVPDKFVGRGHGLDEPLRWHCLGKCHRVHLGKKNKHIWNI